MDGEYQIGQTLIVELDNEILVGDLKLVSADGRIIELANVRDFNTGYVYTSTQCLPRPLIKSIKKCKTSKPEPGASSAEEEQAETVRIEHVPREDSVCITSSEIDQMQTVIAGAAYIFQTDNKYHKALADIMHQSVIALQVDPTEYGRHNKTSLLTIATNQNVYIFDLILLGKLFKELKNILQSLHPKKIVYYSNKAADNLKYQHGVELAGVFDVYVANCLISKQKKPLSFGQCVSKFFNIPQDYFQGEEDLKKDIYQRPLPKTHLDVVARKVVFLFKLYEHMLHDIILKNFYKQCSDFSVAFAANKDDVEVVMQMKPDYMHGTDCFGNEEWLDVLERKLSLNSTTATE